MTGASLMASGPVPKMVRTFSIVWLWGHALMSVEAGLGKGDSQRQADVTQADACTELVECDGDGGCATFDLVW